MGWSIDTQQLAIERIFKKQKRKCKITHPEAAQPEVIIQYSGESLRLDVLNSIVQLFPEFVYIHFVPETISPEDKPAGLGDTVESTGSHSITAV